MQHLDDGTIHAWLDGALGAAEAAAVEAHVATCATCADRVAEARGLIAASSRILTALDDVPADVVPVERRAVVAAARVATPALAATPPDPPHDVAAPRTPWGHRYGRWAAVLAFIAAGTLVLTREANRRDFSVTERKVAPADEPASLRDSVRVGTGAAQKPTPSSEAERRPAPAAAPPAALGGALPRPAPAAPPQAKSLAVAPRDKAAAPRQAKSASALREFGATSKKTDTMAVEGQAEALSARAATRPESLKAGVGGVTVTSAAGAPGARGSPRPIEVDSVQRGSVFVRRETYETGSGQRVVLEITPASAMPYDSFTDSVAPFSAAPANAAAAAADSSSTAIHVIRWRGADGTGYTLSGPVSIERLQLIRPTLGKGL